MKFEARAIIDRPVEALWKLITDVSKPLSWESLFSMTKDLLYRNSLHIVFTEEQGSEGCPLSGLIYGLDFYVGA